MKKVVAFVGSGRKKHTYEAVRRFLAQLEASGDVESEIVRLSEHRIEPCRGCKLCFEKGEEACPLKDDRDVLLAKMAAADGIVFATPNYAFQVSGLLKVFLDRLAFLFHRPRFFGKAYTSLVTQGAPFDLKLGKYLNLVGSCLGCTTVPGSLFTALEPMTEAENRTLDRLVAAHSRRFRRVLFASKLPRPRLFMVLGFRIARTTMRRTLDEQSCDFRYVRDKGWFDSDYYYPVHLGPIAKGAGWLADRIGGAMAKKRRA